MAYRLNLGCGGRPEKGEGWLNHDRVKHSPYVDFAWDLETEAWPLLMFNSITNSLDAMPNYTGAYPHLTRVEIDELRARDVLEHISPGGFYDVMDSAWRMLKTGGVFTIQVPEAGSENAVIDPTHWRGFHVLSLDFLDPETDIGRRNFWCTPHKWRVLEKRRIPGTNVNLAFTLEKRPS